MRLDESQTVSLLPPGIAKMEERKRPATHSHDEGAPPLKRHATSVNGGPKADRDSDMPWKDDLEVCLVLSNFSDMPGMA